MSTHKNIDRICIIAIVISVLLSLLLMNGEAFGITKTANAMGYENRLFDTSKVHTIDIVINDNDWEDLLETAQSEEYSECSAVIDGEAYKNIAIRCKGNTSLSNVSSMDSERYSFKIEFDKYDKNINYYGLDKLCLNNIIQDNTYMKDYLTYQMMSEFGVDSPLCSYVYITVNGQDWGLYLAVEGIEEGFLERNYGSNYGNLYKPDSISFGGNMEDFADKFDFNGDMPDFNNENASQNNFSPFGMMGEMPENIEVPEDFDFSDMENGGFEMPDMGDFGGGMGSDDVKLQYIDDNPDSYSNIFNSAKTVISDSDKSRLISSLKSLSENSDIENIIDIEKVIRYFVVHNFVCNGDSYTGSMIHNYYLYEDDGQLSMIPWDYNLAFGTFQSNDATGQVNSPIDTPVSGDMSDRPMINWIFENDEYTELYHQYFEEFINSIDIDSIIDDTAELISPYVEKDPTKFCTYEEFETGVSTIKTFCQLRIESIQGQLDGIIPSTSEGQSADDSCLIDASYISLSDMGTMDMGGNMGQGGFGGMDKPNTEQSSMMNTANMDFESESMPQIGDIQPPDDFGGEIPTDENGNMQSDNKDENFNADNKSSFNMNGEMPDFNSMQESQNNNSENNTMSYILFGISVLLLCGGLLFAFKFRR